MAPGRYIWVVGVVGEASVSVLSCVAIAEASIGWVLGGMIEVVLDWGLGMLTTGRPMNCSTDGGGPASMLWPCAAWRGRNILIKMECWEWSRMDADTEMKGVAQKGMLQRWDWNCVNNPRIYGPLILFLQMLDACLVLISINRFGQPHSNPLRFKSAYQQLTMTLAKQMPLWLLIYLARKSNLSPVPMEQSGWQ